MFINSNLTSTIGQRLKSRMSINLEPLEKDIFEIIRARLSSTCRRMVSIQYINSVLSLNLEQLNDLLISLEMKGVIKVIDRAPHNKICEVTLS